MYWENELESLDRRNLESLQVLRLKKTIQSAVNFTNAYGRSGYGNEKAYFVIDTEDVVDARKKLQLAGLSLLSDESIYGIS